MARDAAEISLQLADLREVRSFDGKGNNVENPDWGSTFVHLQRLAPADYSDGISELAGVLRPNARVVSNSVVAQAEDEFMSNEFGGTDFVWQWGQFIDHDLDLTDGAEEAADIEIPMGDPFFDPAGTGDEVIFFNRALSDPSTGTDPSNPREQENEITSWLDGSMVYGSDDTRAAALREGPDSPFLKTSAGDLLPFNVDSLSNANSFVTDPTTLFLAGDVRVNEQVGLAVMHTLFVREHNRWAAILQAERPGVDAETIFQNARRLVVAEIQIITFEEFLPALIGANAIPPYEGYDPTVNPTIFNEFSVAAYRLGHSMVNAQLLRLDAAGEEIAAGHLNLRDAFFNAPSMLQSDGDLDPILRGLAAQLHQKLDAHIVSDLRNFLFGQPGSGGLDLASLNIQRGRDHGVPSYNDTRVALGLPRAASFNDITSDAAMAQALFDTYFDVDEVDLWVGGLAEDPVAEEGSQLGPLFRAILAKQFTDLRDGDRFWYENDLTPEELDRVGNMTLARVIRANTDIGPELQSNVFLTPN
ncbi:MAG: peroxidase family protein [Pseudomonadota bacterium]